MANVLEKRKRTGRTLAAHVCEGVVPRRYRALALRLSLWEVCGVWLEWRRKVVWCLCCSMVVAISMALFAV